MKQINPSEPPAPSVLEDTPCLLCGTTNSVVYFKAYDRIFGGGTYSYMKCGNCGLVYQNPRIKGEYIGEFYPKNSYTWKEAPDEKRLIPKLINRLERFYIFSLFRKEKRYIDNFCREQGIKPKKVLDLGCSTGERLFLFKLDGCETVGVEMSEDSRQAEKTYGIKIINSTIEDFLREKGERFDIITTYHIIEHFPGPVNILRQVGEFLNDDGLLVLEIPNVDSFEFKLFGERCYFLEAPRHYTQFTPAALKTFLEKSGFNLVAWHTRKPFFNPSPMILNIFPFLETRRMRINELDGKDFSFFKRLFLAIGVFGLAPFAYLAGMAGKGTSITAFAKKQTAFGPGDSRKK